MPLKFHPEPGTILICDYRTGFKVPEMVKRRPVVTVSPRLKRRDGLVTVVPLSTREPEEPCNYHCSVTLKVPLPAPFDSPTMWVKADMMATVGFDRLDLVRGARENFGKRKYLIQRLEPDQMKVINHCLLHALGMGLLTAHL